MDRYDWGGPVCEECKGILTTEGKCHLCEAMEQGQYEDMEHANHQSSQMYENDLDKYFEEFLVPQAGRSARRKGL